MAMKHAEMWVLGVAGAAVLLLCVVCILLQPTQASGGAQETIGNCEVDVEAMVDLATDSDNDGVINPDKEEPFEQDLPGRVVCRNCDGDAPGTQDFAEVDIRIMDEVGTEITPHAGTLTLDCSFDPNHVLQRAATSASDTGSYVWRDNPANPQQRELMPVHMRWVSGQCGFL